MDTNGSTSPGRLISAATALADRLGISAYLYGGKRDVWEALGYNKNPRFGDYLLKFKRQDIAARVVEMPVEGCWQLPPLITDDEDPGVDTAFDKALLELDRRLRLLFYMRKVDVLSGIGSYGVLTFGMAGQRPETPLAPGELVYLTALHEGHAKIGVLNTDPMGDRFGMPESYDVQISGTSFAAKIHWSRTVHVAEDMLEGRVYGTPRMERVLNKLDDMEKVGGASAEGYWRNGVMALALGVDAEKAQFLTPEMLAENREQAEAFVHGFQRVLGMRGVDVNRIAPDLVDPRGIWQVLVQQLSGATGIPARVLVGSERGELASAQDERAWADRLVERRAQHVEPVIIRPVINKLIEIGALPTPINGNYEVVWPSVGDAAAQQKSMVAERTGRAMQAYAAAEAAAGTPVLSRDEFRQLVWGLEPEDPGSIDRQVVPAPDNGLTPPDPTM